MPLYDYRCRDCQKTTEVRHGVGEPFTGTCPSCGGAMARVFNPAGIVFKGSGFYVNDSRAATSAASKRSGKGTKSTDGSTPSGDAPTASSDAPSAPSPAGSSDAAGAGSTDSGPKKSDTAA